MELNALISKYNVPAPRYTSYPTVPFWDNERFEAEGWKERVATMFRKSGENGISIYIHLPFCESLCTYCGCNTRITKNHQVEEPYLNAVLKEWRMYESVLGQKPIHIAELHLGGGTPTFFNAENLKQLIEGILAGNQVADNATFSFEAHPANTTEEHLQVLYDLGFRRLSLGIQDFDDKVQFVINRKQSIEDVQRVMALARKIGYNSINFDLIYGLPLQTLDTVRHTIEVSLALSPERISFYSYAHVPWLKPGQRRFTELDLPVGEDKLNLYKLGKQLIQQAGYQDVGMDHFAKETDSLFISSQNGDLHRNFMGYADRYTPLLIGLGVSSISDSWTGFAQNVKTVEAYYEKLKRGELPVFKGHFLDEEDLRIRQYILDMMCRGRVLLEHGTALSTRIKQRLTPLVADNLVCVEEDEVLMTEIGKSFLRNICMAFDERMLQVKERENLFSQAI